MEAGASEQGGEAVAEAGSQAAERIGPDVLDVVLVRELQGGRDDPEGELPAMCEDAA